MICQNIYAKKYYPLKINIITNTEQGGKESTTSESGSQTLLSTASFTN